MTQLLVDAVHRALALDAQQAVELSIDLLLGFCEFGQLGAHLRPHSLIGQVVLNGVGQHEVAVGQTLHQGRSTQTVGTVVGEVALTDSEQAGDGGLQLVVNPDTTHCVVDSGIDHHGLVVLHAIDLVGQVAGEHVGDLLIHLKQVAVALHDDVESQTVDRLREVQIDGQTSVVHAEALVAALLGGTAGHVARNEVAEGGIAALQIVVAVLLGNVPRLDLVLLQLLGVLNLLRHPDTTVVTQRLRHQCQLRLLVTMHGDTGGVNLHVRGICKVGTLTIALNGCGAVASHSVG